MSPTDAELLRRSKRDPDAFVAVYDRWAADVQAWLAARCGDAVVATDLTAETFAQALRHAGRFRDETDGSAGPWLFGIASNLLHRYWRRQKVDVSARRKLGMRLTPWVEDHAEEVAERLAVEGAGRLLHAALNRLPPEQREAIALRVLEGLGYDEIALRLAVSEQAARSRVSRGLKSLRTEMEGRV
ncbi:RNA polymerase sigma factor [Solirubrobacter sp. CPCC 204708]|uniref:RNA polymerase sigma factor n=1 Tax=Solirubrobacter deserti TaxID=2282478 RepID=A0ABT4RS02_9ACTN|nr:RNA polymerase sigma factor [Solirubrobacter deserti]MBE2317578.1 RNA polymerase sigma factor [Solirubrobacter deserti]MDA0141272.1 RNA polymerase sigma factor [Solirubrobacter deserti]